KLGCHVILTNSNHPLVHELYEPYEIEVVNTRRNISSKAKTRTGEDVIVTVKPHPRFGIREVPRPVEEKALSYPPTRYMGSKEKLLPYIQDVASHFKFDSALDLFSGSGVVGYLFKTMGKQVFSNDYMAMSATFSKAMIENNCHTLTGGELDRLFAPNANASRFVQNTYSGLYYTDEENAIIDLVRSNIKKLPNSEKRAIAMSALIRACLKKRARGIFTYTGLRYDDGRADLRMSMEEQIRNAAALINAAVFDNGQKNRSRHGDAMTTRFKADLVYIDPPYYSPLSDNEYVRRYHFVEGLARNWEGVDVQWHTKTKKFKSYPTPFSTRSGARDAFDKLFSRMKDSVLLVSYSSNSLPSREEIISLMSKYKRHVEVIDIDYRYSFANQGGGIKNEVKEYLFVGF
ncbi:MAG: DNA adenine methylase, partial [Candidatus Bathyarchaeia archaeon]